MTETPLNMTAGLPYNRRIRIKDGKNVWSLLGDFEIRSEVRVSESPTATLKTTLSSFFNASFDVNDIILDLNLTGKDTRSLSGGYYDVVLSDTGSVDARAIRVLFGRLQLEQMVTGV